MNKTPINILIVDAQTLVRAGIKQLLNETKGIKVVGEAASGEEAISLARELSPHIILMDTKMKGADGVEVTRKILHFHPRIKVLILSASDDVLYPNRLLQVGAAGYLTKDSSKEDLINAILKVYNGQRYISPLIAQKMVLKNVSADDKSPFDLLSNRELQIAAMITKGGKAPTIAKKLNLSSKTINTYRYRIFKKLGLNNSDVELTHLALRWNFVDSM